MPMQVVGKAARCKRQGAFSGTKGHIQRKVIKKYDRNCATSHSKGTNFMTKKLTILPAALLASSAFGLTATGAHAANVDVQVSGPVIELSVSERIDSAPDTARMSTGVTTKAPTAQQALRENAQKMDVLVRKIKALGIAEKDIQTSGININAQFDYRQNEEPRLTGYQASNQVQIIVRDIDNLGDMIDALVGAGANNLNGPYFSLEDDNGVKAAARKKAMESGRVQALEYARLSGYENVRIVSISEAISGSSSMQRGRVANMAMDSMAEQSTPVQPGQVGTSVTVNVTYEMTR